MMLSVNTEGAVPLVQLTSELSIYTVGVLKAALLEASAQAERIDVDLSQVTEVDTAGLQFMLLAARFPGKSVRFVNLSPTVQRLYDLAHLD